MTDKSENIKAPQHFSVEPELQKEAYLPMLHGKPTDKMATMNSKQIIENKINDTGVIDTGGVKLVLKGISKLDGSLGISTHKLLSYAMAIFTEQNHTGSKSREIRDSTVKIPLNDYIKYCGYDLENKNSVKEARRKIKKDLAILRGIELSWQEEGRGSDGDYIDVGLVSSKGIVRNHIFINFTKEFSEYLIMKPITQYPMALLGIDNRNSNAYNIGFKMAVHYSIDNNQIKGTSQLLKVKTLLKETNLPTIDSPSVKKAGWNSRIKEPFENALESLIGCGFLEDWEYTHSKGVARTNEEANFETYEEWEDSLVYFTIRNAPDHTARLEAREAEKKEIAAKSNKSKKKGSE